METVDAAILLIGGMCAGVVNAMAGGGSTLTVPLLVVAGVPGVAANGSNRVGILTSTVSTFLSFRHEGKTVTAKTLLPIVPPAVLGSAIGAFGVSQLTNDRFEQVFGLLMIPVILLTLRKPEVEARTEPWPVVLMASAAFVIGIYAGAIQAGVGLILLAVLSRSGMDLVTANVVKVIFTFFATLVALPVFIFEGHVRWLPAIVLAIGLSAGGWAGAKFAVRGGEKPIRVLMVIAAGVLALRLLGFWAWFFGAL